MGGGPAGLSRPALAVGLAQGFGPLARVGREALGVLFWAVLSQTAGPLTVTGGSWQPMCQLSHVWVPLGSRGLSSFPPPPFPFHLHSSLLASHQAGARRHPCPHPPGLLLLQRRALDSTASRAIANWGEKGPDCLGPGRAVWAAESAGEGGQLRPAAAAGDVCRLRQRWRAGGAGSGEAGQLPALRPDNAVIVGPGSGSLWMKAARAS